MCATIAQEPAGRSKSMTGWVVAGMSETTPVLVVMIWPALPRMAFWAVFETSLVAMVPSLMSRL